MLVITIIAILILAAAVIITLNNNNPVEEANKARYESDCANMQAVFTNTVAKVMTHNKATVSITAGQINTTTKDVKETTGEVSYTVTDAINVNNSNGKIVFGKGDNTDTVFYTGKQLPIYSAGDTKWYVDSEGTISLEVAGVRYGNGEEVLGGEQAEEDIDVLRKYFLGEEGAGKEFNKISNIETATSLEDFKCIGDEIIPLFFVYTY